METQISFRIIALLFLILILCYTLFLIRVGKISAHLSISWILTEIILIIVVAIKPIGDFFIIFLGENNFFAVVLILIIGWIISLMLNTLTRVSDLTNKVRSVIQENAMLRERVERLERRIDNSSEPAKTEKRN